MNKFLIINLIIFSVSACDELDLPDFQDPTVVITEHNFDEILLAKNMNNDTLDFNYFWATDFLNNRSILKTEHEVSCATGTIYGKSTDYSIGDGYFEILADIDFNDCTVESTNIIGASQFYYKMINGQTTEKSSEGNFTLFQPDSTIKFTDHYYHYTFEFYTEEAPLIITEYAQITINSNNINVNN